MSDHTKEQCPLRTLGYAAWRLGLTKQTVRNWIAAGRIPVVRLSERAVRIRDEDLEAIIDDARKGPTGHEGDGR